MLRIPPPNVGDERQPAPRHPNGSQRSSAMVPRQGNTDTATWCVLGSSDRLGEAPQASPLRRLSAFSHRAISFHENPARDRGMSRGPRTVVSFGSCIWRALGVRPRAGHAPSAARGDAPRGPPRPPRPGPPSHRLAGLSQLAEHEEESVLPQHPRRRHVNCRAGDAVAGRTARPGRTLCATLRRPPFLSPCRLFL